MSVRVDRAAVAAGVLAGLAITAGVTSCSTSKQNAAQAVLQVGAIPDQNPEKLNRLYDSLSQELSERLDVPVRYVPVSNYAAAVSAFRTGSLDLVWFGGLTGVQARLQTPGALFWLNGISMPHSPVFSSQMAPAACAPSPVLISLLN